MKHPSFGSRTRLSREMTQLSWLAVGLSQAGSRIERTHWHTRLQQLVAQLLTTGDDETLNTVLNRLGESEPVAHDALMDTIESTAETTLIQQSGHDCDVLLIACPLLAWSRYGIPTPTLSAKDQTALIQALKDTVLSRQAEITLVDRLLSPDQMPREFTQSAQLTRDLAQALASGQTPPRPAQPDEETNRFLSDTRYLIAAVAVPQGETLFRWQDARSANTPLHANDRQAIAKAWSDSALKTIEPLFAGCHITLLSPEAFHAACAAADRAARPHSIEACVRLLTETINLPPAKQRAVISPFYAHGLEEYRIGLGPRDNEALYHGIVWPILGIEDEQGDMPAEIEQALRALGVTDIVIHEHRFPMEYCDDCGSPMYANADAELAHLEPPEAITTTTELLH